LIDGKVLKNVAAIEAKESQEQPLMMNSLITMTMDEEKNQRNL
jgi:hypothetical protein